MLNGCLNVIIFGASQTNQHVDAIENIKEYILDAEELPNRVPGAAPLQDHNIILKNCRTAMLLTLIHLNNSHVRRVILDDRSITNSISFWSLCQVVPKEAVQHL